MLPANEQVRETYLGTAGVFATAQKGARASPLSASPRGPFTTIGALCIDSSTVDPTVSREVAAKGQESGIQFVDAPVSGGESLARPPCPARAKNRPQAWAERRPAP